MQHSIHYVSKLNHTTNNLVSIYQNQSLKKYTKTRFHNVSHNSNITLNLRSIFNTFMVIYKTWKSITTKHFHCNYFNYSI